MTDRGLPLAELLAALPVSAVRGRTDLEVCRLVYDSRQAGPGALFFCLTGLGEDRHAFIPDALARGVSGLVVEREGLLGTLPAGPTLIYTPDARAALARMAALFYRHPSRDLQLIGVTGTNGKTTTTYCLEAILQRAGRRVLRLGTVNISLDGEERPAGATTPESVDLQALLAEARERGLTTAVMEVSSHALVLQRTRECRFAVAVLTNISQDHLDFHGTMERYTQAKRLLFQPAPDGVAGPATHRVFNADDAWGARWAREEGGPVTTFGMGGSPDLAARRIELGPWGSRFTLYERGGQVAEIALRLPGRYNIANALAAAAAARALALSWEPIVAGLGALTSIPGRLEPISEGQPFAVLVDYAHTPDALERLLAAVREISRGRLLVVFGCGGDRDRSKRPQMGAIAARLSDVCILTSDNPRSEDPEVILDEIEAGIPTPPPACVRRQADRAHAIALALELAQPGDTVVIAGKGHEPVQIVGRERRPFDDRQVARAALRARPASPHRPHQEDDHGLSGA